LVDEVAVEEGERGGDRTELEAEVDPALVVLG